MLGRTFEWYRVVDPHPNSDTVDKRRAAAQDIMKALDAEDFMLGCATGVVTGFEENFKQESPVIQSLVSTIRAHDSAFPEDLSENALALRVCAAIALGEVLVSADPEATNDSVLTACLLRSGLGIRPSSKRRHLKQVLDELSDAAKRLLDATSVSTRRRPASPGQEIMKLQPPQQQAEWPEAWKSVISALKKTVPEIVKQSSIDREEIDVLWWMFSGESTIMGRPFATMPPGASAVCCGAELGAQCLLPPTLSLEAMVRRAYETGRDRKDMTERNVEELVNDWNEQIASALVPTDEIRHRAQTYPALFPLSWVSERFIVGKGVKGWLVDLKQMTGLPPNHASSPVDWAVQAFRERVAHRVLSELSVG